MGRTYHQPYSSTPPSIPTSHHQASGFHPSLPSRGQVQIARQFPPAFNIYSQTFSSEFLIGAHKELPIYVMKTHSGFSGNPPIVLHNGPSSSLPTLAALDYHSFSSRMTITLPPPPGPGISVLEEKVDGRANGLSHRYVFSIEVNDASSIRENFEWPHSHHDAIDTYTVVQPGGSCCD
jgi:hypothetical protein